MTKTVKLTDEQRQVLSYLNVCRGPATQTEIGLGCNKLYYQASSWAAGALKSLIADGLVSAKNRPCYSITNAGLAALKQQEPSNG